MIRKVTIAATLALTCAVFTANAQFVENQNRGTENLVVDRSPDLRIQPGKSLPGFDVESLSAGAMRFTGPEEIIPITLEHPFVALGITWEATVAQPHQIEIEVRSSINARDWTDWMSVEIDHHVELEAGHYAGSLVFLEKGTQYLQYRATLKPHMTFREPELNSIRFNFINPGMTQQADLDAHRATVPEMSDVRSLIERVTPENFERSKESPELEFTASFDLPEYVARTSWGSSLGLTNTASRSVTTVTHLIVHHSAGNYSASQDFAAVVRSYYSYHTGPTLGWADIGYNWLVDRNGVIYQGRAFNFDGNMNVVGAHFSGRNGATMGICVIGTYTSTLPTDEALDRLRTMLAWKATQRGIDVRARASHSAGNIFTISGHRDGGATECPGQRLYNYLPTLRTRTFAYMNPPEMEILAAETTTGHPNRFEMELGIKNFGQDAIVFVEFGTEEDNLDEISEDYQVDASDDVEVLVLNLADLQPSTTYYYRLVAVNAENFRTTEIRSFQTAGPTSIEREEDFAQQFVLEQNYPNPFNPTTNIVFEITEASNVRVLIYNSQGQMIGVPADRAYSAGRHSVTFDASGVASGVLIYSLEIDGVVVNSRKMLLLR